MKFDGTVPCAVQSGEMPFLILCRTPHKNSFWITCSLFLHMAQTHNPWGWDRSLNAPSGFLPMKIKNLAKKDFNNLCSPLTTDNLLVIPLKTQEFSNVIEHETEYQGGTQAFPICLKPWCHDQHVHAVSIHLSIVCSNRQRRKYLT